MGDFNNFVGKDVDDLRLTADGFRRGDVAALEVRVPVKMITGLGNANEPVDGFESLMCLGFFIVNAEGWRMCDENVECASIIDFV